MQCSDKEPNYGGAVSLLIVAALVVGVCLYFCAKYRQYLTTLGLFAHMKVSISFFTILATVDTQVNCFTYAHANSRSVDQL